MLPDSVYLGNARYQGCALSACPRFPGRALGLTQTRVGFSRKRALPLRGSDGIICQPITPALGTNVNRSVLRIDVRYR